MADFRRTLSGCRRTFLSADAGLLDHLGPKRNIGLDDVRESGKQRSVGPANTPPDQAALEASIGMAAFRGGIVIAATPITTQASPSQAVGDRRSPRKTTPMTTPIGTRR